MIVAMPQSIWSNAESFLFTDQRERFGFFLCGVSETSSGPRFCVQEFVPIDNEDVMRGPGVDHQVDLDVLLDVINRAKQTDRVLLEIHTHPLTDTGVRFSELDDAAMPEFASYVLDSLDGRPYGALVAGQSSVDGRYWLEDQQAEPINRVLLTGETFELRIPTSSERSQGRMATDLDRFDRQVRLFGDPGQDQLGQLTVGVVGAGGIGSHVIQQLAYAGVRSFRIVDPDEIEESNLNRTVGATPSNVGSSKVVLAERHIHEIVGNDAVDVVTVDSDLGSAAAIRTLLETDLVVGCMDNDGGRQVLNDVARSAHLPYIDVASGIETADETVTEIGGRIAVVHPDGPCLHCMNEIDRREARYFLKPAKEREADREAGYFDPEWEIPNPSVVSLNGVVASQAVSELMLYGTGFDSISTLVYYYLRETASESQRCARRRVAADPECYTCTLRGVGKQANLKRYMGSNDVADGS